MKVGRFRLSGRQELFIAIIAAVVIVCVGLFAYVAHEISVIGAQAQNQTPQAGGPPSIGAIMAGQDLLSYNNGADMAPYALVDYTYKNASSIGFNGTIFKVRPPGKVYLLYYGNQCYSCGQINEVVSNLTTYLNAYGFVNSTYDVVTVDPGNLTRITNDSVLIVLNGVLPRYMLNPVNSTELSGYHGNQTMLAYLLSKSTSVFYVGQNFSRVLLPGSIVIPAGGIPGYLATVPLLYNQSPVYYNNQATFQFVNGSTYGPIAYIKAGNGYIASFSNYLGSWKSPAEAGADIARAVSGLVWLPRAASGSSTVQTKGYASGGAPYGVIMDGIPLAYNYSNELALNGYYGRIVVSTKSQVGRTLYYDYKDIRYTPAAAPNGTMAMQSNVTPNVPAQLSMEVFTGSKGLVEVAPHLTVYDQNMSPKQSIYVSNFNASGNFTFFKNVQFALGQGRYIVKLQAFNNSEFAASTFTVPNVSVYLKYANYSSGSFLFGISSAGQQLNGINYTIKLNGLYGQSGTFYNGTINYTLPKGAPVVYGNATFEILMLSNDYRYIASNPPTVIHIDKEYIEIAIVLAVVIMLVTLVKSPTRDEFYIDVPNLPEQKSIPIKMKLDTVLGVFDKQNLYFHWKYMPLTSDEVRVAIANNIRYNSMPVSLTLNNVEMMLDQMAGAGHLLMVDGLYAPKSWEQQSGHDAAYLATFKKLRVYFVTHAYVFTELDSSSLADIVATFHGERAYIVIHSKTSKFKRMPVYQDATTYLAFLNAEEMDEFRESLYRRHSKVAEELKLNLSSGSLKLIDADDAGKGIG
ncbi:MAG: hypothetical protein KGH98_00805 [Candidatus Micrarchaeota archaeon]|nr:hypothetical protein [Candidatus Micrarchaeota archaeon]